MSIQPVISNVDGAILTAGFIQNTERVAIVEPWVIDRVAPDYSTLCKDLVNSWIAGMQSLILAAMAADTSIVFVSAEGMVDGRVPYRVDYAPGANPGTISGGSLPSNVTGILTYYEDPADSSPGQRIRAAKTFMPGVPEADVTGQTPSDPLRLLWAAYGNAALNGVASVLYSSQAWWRVLASPKPRSTVVACRRIISYAARGYVGTQRRRLLPR